MKTFALLAIATLTQGCPAPPIPAPARDANVVPQDDAGHLQLPDANITIPRVTACEKANANLVALGCSDVTKPPVYGQSFVQVCSHAASTGAFDLRPECLANAGTIAEARACGTVSCK